MDREALILEVGPNGYRYSIVPILTAFSFSVILMALELILYIHLVVSYRFVSLLFHCLAMLGSRFFPSLSVIIMSVIILMAVWVVAVSSRRTMLRDLYPVLFWDIVFTVGFALIIQPWGLGDLIMNIIDGKDELKIFWEYFKNIPWYRKVLIVLFFRER